MHKNGLEHHLWPATQRIAVGAEWLNKKKIKREAEPAYK